jgi:hypothetical protein
LALLLLAPDQIPAQTNTNSCANLWFPVGEELMFRVTWGIIPVGWSRASSEWIDENGEKLLKIRYKVRTNKLFDPFYPMDDQAESIVDPATFLPRSFSFVRKYRRSRYERNVTFHHDAGFGVITSPDGEAERLLTIAPDTRDILSFMYHHRKATPAPNTEEIHRVMAPEGLLDLKLHIKGRDTVKLPKYGRVGAIIVEPEMNYAGILIAGGKVKMWVSEDARCLGMRLDVHAPLADARATLCGVTGPGNDRWVAANPAADCADSNASTNSAETGSP